MTACNFSSTASPSPPPLLSKNMFSAAAKSLQSCQTLCDPIDSSPPGSSVHGILQDVNALDKVALDLCSLLCIQTGEEPVIYVFWGKIKCIKV